MSQRIAVRGEYEVWRIEAPTAEWFGLLEGVSWGTEGLRYRLLDVAHIFEHWTHAHFLEVRREGSVVAVFTLVPRRYEIEGMGFDAWYYSMLAVKAGAAGAGLGRIITEAFKEKYLDEAEGPVLLYGFIEVDNLRSMKLHEKLGYTPMARFEGTLLGSLRPRRAEGLRKARESDRDVLVARLRAFWKGYQLDDVDQSLDLASYWVLERDGRVVAGGQALEKPLRIENLSGPDGRFLMATSPWLSRLSPFFQVDPHRQLWLGHFFFEGPGDWKALTGGLQHQHGSASLVLYMDPRGPVYEAVKAAGLGMVNRLAGSPLLDVMIHHKGLPEPVVTALKRGPIWYSPLDAA